MKMTFTSNKPVVISSEVLVSPGCVFSHQLEPVFSAEASVSAASLNDLLAVLSIDGDAF